MADISATFQKAVALIGSLPPDGPAKPSVDEQLAFYALFKQASTGPCNVPAPSRLNFVAKKKWDSWSALGQMSKQEAMQKYVKALADVAARMEPSKERDEVLATLGQTAPKSKL
eukprot:gnl/Hemi2/5484_TR1882_c0_g8_i1.p2 gnl/Hemi2/5484_TR1882_c0_g8~~gnl/Hemi2/5484_TR1882_c0_g8_i1.p2  ORF type:complete len:114 (-),score=45.06 gnl/Hemi2/5484_TR1882_c0_g8_i1:83-424(-)